MKMISWCCNINLLLEKEKKGVLDSNWLDETSGANKGTDLAHRQSGRSSAWLLTDRTMLSSEITEYSWTPLLDLWFVY